MNDPERQELLLRLAESERARRRWKILALAGTPVLAFLLIIVTGNALTSGLALRGMVKRQREEAEQLKREVEEIRSRLEAERDLQEQQEALRAAEEARVRAEGALKERPPAEKEP